jgi:Fe2+ transport system protein B
MNQKKRRKPSLWSLIHTTINRIEKLLLRAALMILLVLALIKFIMSQF